MTERTYTMSQKEIDRIAIIHQVAEKKIRQKEAAKVLGISSRQVRRLLCRYRESGDAGLLSYRRGRPGNNRIEGAVRKQAMELIHQHYSDFGPTLACEKLAERDGIQVSRETLRKWMIEEELWVAKPVRQRTVHQLRERRSRFGELVQIDGSPHDWFEGRSEKCTLLVFIDDATSRLLYLRFVPAETTVAYMEALQLYLGRYGRPVSLYSDRHSIFRINREEPEDGNTLTQFGRALNTLDIEAIHARTPQAKGRVERANKTLQDRLVKEMRLRGIDTPEQGNAFLEEYMETHNQQFAVAPCNEEDAHREVLHSEREIELILSHQDKRRLSKNLICQHRNTQYQITTTGKGYRLQHAEVTVCELLSGEIVILRGGKEMAYTTYRKGERPPPVVDEKGLNQRVDVAQQEQKERKEWKPAPDHPWKRQPTGFSKRGIAAASG